MSAHEANLSSARNAAPSFLNGNGEADVRAPFGLVLLALAGLVAMSITLGVHPLFDPDEGRNAEVSRGMAARNDYVLPKLNALPYLDKPVLYFAAAAGFMEILGPTATAARLPALLFALATSGVLLWFGSKLFGVEGGWIAAIVSAANPLMIAFSRIVIFDSALTFFVTVAVVFFYVSMEEGDARRRWSVVAWGAMALGILTKGPVAILLPAIIVVPFAIWRGSLRRLMNIWSVILFAAIVVPWLVATSLRVPDFLEYSLVTETVNRVTTNQLQRTGPFWYFVPYLLVGLFPWSILAPAGLKRKTLLRVDGRRDERTIFLLLWLLLPFLFFSISQSKRPQYILPLVPAVALLVARIWMDRTRAWLPARRVTGIVMTACGLAFTILGTLDRVITLVRPGLIAPIRFGVISLGVLLILGGVVASVAPASRWVVVLAAIAIPIFALPLVLQRLLSEIGETRSSSTIAIRVAPSIGPGGQLIGLNAYSPSLSFYLNRETQLSSSRAEELTSNYLMSQYARYAGTPGSTLHPVEWGGEQVFHCRKGNVFLATVKDSDTTRVLADRFPLITDDGEYAVYGPCRGDSPGTFTAAGER
ncbi:MAG TPA: glycosyltransferase family 39 protein [Thermoanaerobaculia bacterium]|nr:glycosyltransferase family 39 protein [Thermoanaerobaculia bacterium]